jgi:hypothetical protein
MSLLDYAPPFDRRPRAARQVLIGLAICAGVLLSLPLFHYAMHHLSLMHLYRKCANATLSERTYVEKWTSGEIARYTEGCADWRTINAELSSNIASNGTIFLGELRTPDRSRTRLVGIDVLGWSTAPGGLVTHARTIIAGSAISLPRYGVASQQTIPLPLPEPTLVMHRPQLDGADPSHFTITFESGKERGTIDGWLKDDETVVLEPHRDALATTSTAPPPPSPGKSP